MKQFKLIFIFLLCNLAIKATAQKNNVFLDKAFWKGQPSLSVVKQKIKEGHNPTQLTAFGFDAITGALFAKADNIIIKYLLSINGNGVNKLTHDGRTYLFWAAYKGNLEIMQHLVDNGAKTTNIVDDKGYTPLTFTAVVGQKNPALYDFFIKHGANVLTEKSKEGANVLLLLIPYLDNFEMVTYFESKGVHLNSTDAYGNGAFNYTARTGNIDMLNQLVEKGLDYKTPNTKGGNAFIFASQGTRRKKNGLKEYAYLESLGINPNVTTIEGVNPLHSIAYSIEDKAVFDYFIAKGVSVNQQNQDGNTPFMNASAYNTLDVVKHLLPQVKEINLKNKKGQTALSKAVESNSKEVVSFLLDHKADANILDKEGNSLAYYLVNSYRSDEKNAFFDKVKLLNAYHVDLSAKQAKKNTLYHIAIKALDKELISFLSDKQIDINAVNAEGLTVLHMAAMKAKDDEILKHLIALGADKQIKTEFEESVYDLAKENELLKANGINLEFLN